MWQDIHESEFDIPPSIEYLEDRIDFWQGQCAVGINILFMSLIVIIFLLILEGVLFLGEVSTAKTHALEGLVFIVIWCLGIAAISGYVRMRESGQNVQKLQDLRDKCNEDQNREGI